MGNAFQPSSVEYRIVSPTNDFIRFEDAEVQQSIPSRFEKQVAKYPDRLAVKTKTQQFTYDELNKVANRVARAILEKRGEGQETIALVMEHGASIVVALLGVLKAGKIYVPLDSSLPRGRLDYMLNDSEAALILTNNKNVAFAKELSNDADQLINIDKLDSNLSTENPDLPIPPEAFAYIMYTSGSTGQPKGVIEDHLDVLHFTQSTINSFHLRKEDRLILVGSFCFSGSSYYIYSALLNGAAVLPFDIETEGIENLAGWVMDEEITLYGSAPGIFRGMVASLIGEEVFPKLRFIRLGGDKIFERDVELYRKYFSQDCIFRVGVGSSEMKFFREFFIDKEMEIIGNSVPVGYPVKDVEVLMLDDDGNDVGFNEVGEMVIKSRYISPGYWRKPEVTAKTFKPAAKGSDERLYYTGDMGIMAPDGCLYHLGRKDFQVKIRGYRIEIGEVENAIAKLDSVKEAAVVSRADVFGEQRLVAYLVPAMEHLPAVNELRRALSDNLPDYMIPSAFVTMDALPLNHNGKIDRQALSAPDTARPELDEVFVEPRDGLELEIAGIWKKVLGLDSVGVRDNFLELGGSSILATRVLAQIQEEFGKAPSLTRVLHASTVEQMADILRQKDWSPPSSPMVAIQPGGSRTPLFCIHGCGGGVLIYSDLARHLGLEQPLYALRAPGLSGERPPHTRIEDMATHYIKEMQKVQPEGPYHLGGVGSGGFVALEMAQQLSAQSQEVGLLALMDTMYRDLTRRKNSSGPNPPSSNTPGSQRLLSYYTRRLVYHYRRRELAQSFRNILKRVLRGCYWWLAYSFIFRHISFIRLRINYIKYVRRMLGRAEWSYVPKAYPGQVLYFLSEDRKQDFDDVNWRKVAGTGLEIHIVPGYHSGILHEPNVRILAEHLRNFLDET